MAVSLFGDENLRDSCPHEWGEITLFKTALPFKHNGKWHLLAENARCECSKCNTTALVDHTFIEGDGIYEKIIEAIAATRDRVLKGGVNNESI